MRTKNLHHLFKLSWLLLAFISLTAIHTNAMTNYPDHEDTLTLKGKIVKENMEDKRGTKLEGVQDYYFSSEGKSYFIKTAVGTFTKTDLDKYVGKEITIKCIHQHHGTWDISSNDPSYAATRIGDYIVILNIYKK